MSRVTLPPVPTGVIHQYAGLTTPAGYLLCDGSSITRSTYPSLFSALTITRGNPTVTVASPGVFTLTAHGLSIGEIVYLTTTGALPTGLSANTQYFVASTSFAANTFTLAATYGGTAINTSGTQSGTHTLTSCPYGFASSTTFNVPDLRGRIPMGAGTGTGLNASGGGVPSGTSQTQRVLGNWGGEETHLLSTSEMPSHSHGGTTGNDSPDHNHGTGNGQGFATHISGTTTTSSGSTAPTVTGVVSATGGASVRHAHSITPEGGGSRHAVVSPFVVTNYIIKT